jgi:hypothetical protein
MKNPSGRISENILFAVLVVAVAGWMAGSVAATPTAPQTSHACVASHGAVSTVAASNAVTPAKARCVV